MVLIIKNKILRVLLYISSIILLFLLFSLYNIIFEDSKDKDPKEKVTFKATTPEGKLMEISDHVKKR